MKAKLMCVGVDAAHGMCLFPKRHLKKENVKGEVYVLRAADYDAAVEKMAKAMWTHNEGSDSPYQWTKTFPCGMWRRRYVDAARAVLASIGIRPERKGERK